MHLNQTSDSWYVTYRGIKSRTIYRRSSSDAYFGVLAARAVINPINTRLKPHEVGYILKHSGARLILVDHEYTHLTQGAGIPFIVSNDTGKVDDPYEIFLSDGRQFSGERGWPGLEPHIDENSPCTLCYTYVQALSDL